MLQFKEIPSSLVLSGIPPIHFNSHLSNFDNKYDKLQKGFFAKLLALTEKMLTLNVSASPKYVFLCGTPGSGKTHFMVGLYRAMIQKLGYSQGDGSLFVSYSVLATEMINAMQENTPLRIVLSGYLQSKWLFLDDITASDRVFKENSLEFQTLRDVLLDRYERNLCLIASSNLNSDDLIPEIDRLFGNYVSSRLSNSVIVQFPAVDFRQLK